MKHRILGLLTVGLLAAPMAANATLLTFALTDGTNDISFQLDSNPTPDTSNALGLGFKDVLVSVNGTSSLRSVAFHTDADFGGMTIQTFISQAGQQIFSGTTAAPIFAPGTFDMTHFNDGIRRMYTTDFLLTISTVSVPEPGTLALLGLGLAGLGFTRRRRTN